MAAIDCMAKANDQGFQRRVKYFMQKAAVAIVGESESTDGHTERVAYATTILTGSASIFEVAIAVTTNSTIATAIGTNGGDPSDNDLEFTVNSLINDFAGYDG